MLLRDTDPLWIEFVRTALLISVTASAATIVVEFAMRHSSDDARRTLRLITRGSLGRLFWVGGVAIGMVLPVILLLGGGTALLMFASVAALVGVFCVDYVWVRAPQLIALS